MSDEIENLFTGSAAKKVTLPKKATPIGFQPVGPDYDETDPFVLKVMDTFEGKVDMIQETTE